jgi:hypothetical protein
VTPHPEGEPESLLESFQGLLIGGRWLLVGAELVQILLLLGTVSFDRPWLLSLALLFLHNAVSLCVLHRVPIRRVPVLGILSLDLVFVAVLAQQTGGPRSPFLGQCYLIIFAAALFYGIEGGLLVALISSLVAAALVAVGPVGRWDDLRGLVPYFVLAGCFTGYLVGRLQTTVRMYRESLAAASERKIQERVAQRELTVARLIQKAVLPGGPPQAPGLAIAVRSQPASQVGGDFHLFLSENDRTGLVIGDASGKGIPAALIATSVAHLLPWLAPLEDPRRALSALNRDLLDHLPTDAFVTLTLAEVDPSANCLRLFTAGHPPALICRPDAAVVESSLHNQLLGIFPSWHCEPEEHVFEPGDVLALYSDGLVEARGAGGEMFGAARVMEALARSAPLSVEEIADSLLRAANEWGPPTDDLTLIICKRLPGTPPDNTR